MIIKNIGNNDLEFTDGLRGPAGGNRFIIPVGGEATVFNEDAEKSTQLAKLVELGRIQVINNDEPILNEQITTGSLRVTGSDPTPGDILTAVDATGNAEWKVPAPNGHTISNGQDLFPARAKIEFMGSVVVSDNEAGDATTVAISGGAVEGIPAGGALGEVLAKTSGDDYAVDWVVPAGGGVDNTKVLKTGDTMTGALNITGAMGYTGFASYNEALFTISGDYVGDINVDTFSIAAVLPGTLRMTWVSTAYGTLTEDVAFNTIPTETPIALGVGGQTPGLTIVAHDLTVESYPLFPGGALLKTEAQLPGIELSTNGTVTAGAFIGSGAGLTGVAAIDNSKVAKTGDEMTGMLSINGAPVSSFEFIGWSGQNGTTTFLESWNDTYNGPQQSKSYVVKITGIALPNISYDWSDDGGNTFTSANAQMDTPFYMSNQMGAAFKSTETYAINEQWSMNVNWVSLTPGISVGSFKLTSNYGQNKIMVSDQFGQGSWQILVNPNHDFADDMAAAQGGVQVGQLYHNAGALRVRIA